MVQSGQQLACAPQTDEQTNGTLITLQPTVNLNSHNVNIYVVVIFGVVKVSSNEERHVVTSSSATNAARCHPLLTASLSSLVSATLIIIELYRR